jgi:hypothetical protein
MKKRQLYTSLISLVIILIVGCTKEKTESEFKPPRHKLYIRGNFGNDSLEFLNYTEDINNYYEYHDSPISNGFILIMHEKTTFYQTRFVQIEIWRLDKDTLGIPWENDRIPSFHKPFVNLSLIDLSKTNVEFDSNDSINYTGSTLNEDPIYLKINAITGDTIEGIFHGDIKTRTGLLKHVTNGEFRIKFHKTQL